MAVLGPLTHLPALSEDLLVVRVEAQAVESDAAHGEAAQAGPEHHQADRSLSGAPGQEEQQAGEEN